MREHHDLSDEERARIGMQMDLFVSEFERRHGITLHDAVDAVRYIREHRELMRKLKNSAMLSVIGIIISAAFVSMLEGAKAFFRTGVIK